MQSMPNRIHFVGIGGSGMSGIARVLAESGYEITGSDLKNTDVIEKLRSIGIKCFIGHDSKNIGEAKMVVVSTAIPKNNPEVVEARKRGIPVIHRGEALAILMNNSKGIAVTGSHGKTTTTSMLALITEKSGYDPTVIIGSELDCIGGNAKKGKGEYLIAEADESDGSFLLLNPHMSIITNIEDDHMDYYKTIDNVIAAFKRFLCQVDPKGLAILFYDDPNIQKIIKEAKVPVVTYGMSDSACYRLKNLSLNCSVSSADVYKEGKYIGKIELSVPGIHNLLNALAATALSMNIGIDFKTIAKALAGFKGARRRYQLLGEINGIKVIDDYAHHPTEIKATLKAARQTNSRIIAVFQPHRYTRTKHLYERFGKALLDADVVIISDIYSAGEKPIEGVSTKLIFDVVQKYKKSGEVLYIENLSDIARYLMGIVQPKDIVLTMGAGDVRKCGVELINMLKINLLKIV
ncbi:UDP-N-acetylmuramate--L-alanine ligase [Peptococcaceae bacterium]|nr:UDP-N-acetylmuramate--L-alanine ligase [Peptococcaceae bacterium]MCL0032529.1 UDP-N-acetylmuramate--L-alanine ligase [Peptococcaceae bacterium]MCL0106566.1 UDP-N-acetylmuramate--L-alanine ligase [Peptococcaceae bacterium]